METSKTQLIELISSSELERDQKALWELFIGKLEEDHAKIVLKSLEENPQELVFLTENLQEKLTAIISGDDEAWKNIILPFALSSFFVQAHN